ncbi:MULTISPECIES: hypothetical protein [Peribacillus]|uniref:Uncharacterized protein n=1 Tax=Peribacillus simplex TaxID=1478 RepID=A0A109N1Y7_9BACI|nr:hypothetical protein [Peribacillus simplex]KWW21973.1 hypothetical protein AS888_05710 [Peribacillus simplex]
MSTEKILEQLIRIADALERISPVPDKTEQKEKFDYQDNSDKARAVIKMNKTILDSNRDKR